MKATFAGSCCFFFTINTYRHTVYNELKYRGGGIFVKTSISYAGLRVGFITLLKSPLLPTTVMKLKRCFPPVPTNDFTYIAHQSLASAVTCYANAAFQKKRFLHSCLLHMPFYVGKCCKFI